MRDRSEAPQRTTTAEYLIQALPTSSQSYGTEVTMPFCLMEKIDIEHYAATFASIMRENLLDSVHLIESVENLILS